METIQQLLSTACDDMGGEVNIRSYSGRAMYGKQCVGITGSQRDCQKVIAATIGTMVQDLVDEAVLSPESGEAYNMNDNVQQAIDKLMSFSSDSMGYDVILYWPQIEWAESEEEVNEG